jgi:protein deglycase
MSRVLVPLAEGCEEIEAVIVVDTLRRAGIEVVTAGLRPGPVTASRGVRLLPDADWPARAWETFDALVLPGGGPGTQALLADVRVIEAVRRFHDAGRWVAAICAAPQVLQKAGVLAGKRMTCYPGVAAATPRETRVDEPVVQDGHVITSQGPGTGFAFALALVRLLAGAEKARDVGRALLVPAV